MPERRRIKRKELIFYLKVFDKERDQLIGHLSDISIEGFKLISEKPIQVGEIYHFKTRLSQKMIGGEQLLFEARSIWCRKNDHLSDFYDVGFRFEDLQSENHQKIEEWFQISIQLPS